ncbi:MULTISPECIES: Pr6Pr family membrane protein [unclassified Frigoribacterium]|uniref:Pr6Pr family membrane protein n=1 Tax=unclassified Frigoribacterium TaxID=2627005 RepID=UPI001563210B|nr:MULTISPECIES: Pr6Pr family membrane protein [unclassified Frigoribacterium]NQW86631.1 Pr6Pr family membrane protein [Frigoribacterium sp. VKM Ac-2860]NQX07962.1 Pr6Pr family membrane protein [Frigoribacterium sp. VKM Ac-2859]
MRASVAVLRVAAAVAVLVAVVAQWENSLRDPGYRFVDFFGYFTIQSNLIVLLALAIGAITVLRRTTPPRWTVAVRAAATTYIALTGLVFNLLLAGLPSNDPYTVGWASDVFHRVIPLYVVLDWVLFADRDRQPWRRLWQFLAFPLIWVVVVLARGADFVPYPFLDVATLGGGVVALWCVGIAVAVALIGALVVAASRLRLVDPDRRVTQRNGS